MRDPDVRVLYPQTGVSKLTVVDEAEITRRYGIPGRAYGDFAILRGDPSDGLPGVRGIGEKTASRSSIAEHGSLDGIARGDQPRPGDRQQARGRPRLPGRGAPRGAAGRRHPVAAR